MAGKKQIKLEDEVNSEILVADTNSESGAEASNVRRLFWGRRGTTTTTASLSRSPHNKHWPAKSTQLCCRLRSSRSQRKGTVHKCTKYDVGLCVVPCFAKYHTKVNL